MNDALGLPQSAVVIGGSSEIGAAIVERLADYRLRRVILVGRDQSRLDPVVDRLNAKGATVTCVVADVTDVDAMSDLATSAAATLGQIDLVLVAAGVLGNQEADAKDPTAAASVLNINFTGCAVATLALANQLRIQGHGRIVVLSTVAGIRVRKANYIYGASKAGLDAFAQGLAADLEGSGVGLTIVRPGWVATAMTSGMKPAPFATTADKVAADVVSGLERGSDIVWSPKILAIVFTLLRHLPKGVWRKLPG